MIKYVTGNMFESKAECLVNTVNCEGYMGKGIAYQFKLRFPENNRDYMRACRSGELHIGTLHYFCEDGTMIVNFPTKNKWREKSQLSYVTIGLDRLVEFINEKKPSSIAIPPLGCGNGGLAWSDVKEIIDCKLSNIENDCEIIVYEPSVSYKLTPKEPPKVNVSALVLLQIRMHLSEFGSLRLQKAGYFVNYFLGDEYFKFDKWRYGPYSHAIDIVARSVKEYQQYYNLKNSEETYTHIYNVICSEKTESKMQKLLPAIEKATAYVNNISGDKKLEGVATVLYIVQESRSSYDGDKIVESFKNWSEDKAKRFSVKYINDCIEYLVDSGIIAKNIFGNYEVASEAW